MKKLKFLFILLYSYIGFSQYIQQVASSNLGGSLTNSRNINHKDGTFYQDIKKSVVHIIGYNTSMTYYNIGSGNLLNTVENTFNGNSQKYYILTADHVLFSKAVNIDLNNVFISFEYEMAHSTNRGTSIDAPVIGKICKVPLNIVFNDPKSDIALFEIKTNELSDSQKIFFQNVYASGWTTNPSVEFKNYINISHPRGDHKKIYTNPSSTEYYEHDGFITPHGVKGPELNFKAFGRNWNNTGVSPETGSSGSAFFDVADFKNSVAGVFNTSYGNGETAISLLENSWKISGGKGLQDYLDPNNTWISNIPGGYLNDLIKNDETNFDFYLNSNLPIKKEHNINLYKYFRLEFIGKLTEDYLGAGIIADSNIGDTDKVYLTVSLKEDPNYLLYGVEFNPKSTYKTIFKGTAWDSSNPPIAGLPGKSNDYSYMSLIGFGQPSTDIKSSIIKLIKRKNNENSSFKWLGIKELQNSNTSVEVVLQKASNNDINATKIKAIKLPKYMPINAVEFFDPSRFANLWRSRTYKESRGISSDNLYIDKVTIGTKTVSTGNNGGYLNMASINQTFGPLNKTLNEYLDISVKIATTLSGNYYYKAWVDFTPDVDINYNYNFVDEGEIISAPELIGKGQGTGNNSTITINHRLPSLTSQGGNEKHYRLRIAVSSEDNVTQDGVYENGEVEDYFIRIKSSTVAKSSMPTNEIENTKQETFVTPIVFPNPANDFLNIVIPNKKSDKIKVNILDLTGKIIYEKVIELNDEGNFIIRLDDINLQNSSYILKVVGNYIDWATTLIINK